jgi:hypothetical protein
MGTLKCVEICKYVADLGSEKAQNWISRQFVLMPLTRMLAVIYKSALNSAVIRTRFRTSILVMQKQP